MYTWYPTSIFLCRSKYHSHPLVFKVEQGCLRIISFYIFPNKLPFFCVLSLMHFLISFLIYPLPAQLWAIIGSVSWLSSQPFRVPSFSSPCIFVYLGSIISIILLVLKKKKKRKPLLWIQLGDDAVTLKPKVAFSLHTLHWQSDDNRNSTIPYTNIALIILQKT